MKMTSQYLENHRKELEALAKHYESHNKSYFDIRAKAIRDLIKRESLKIE